MSERHEILEDMMRMLGEVGKVLRAVDELQAQAADVLKRLRALEQANEHVHIHHGGAGAGTRYFG